MKAHTKLVLRNLLSSIIVVLIMIVGFFSITSIVFNIVYTPAPIKSYSMCPTLNNDVPDVNTYGDYAYMNKFATYTNNDIVIAKPTTWNTEAVIKRLVGLPGDVIEIRDETSHYGLYVNNILLYNKDKTDFGYKTKNPDKGSNAYYEDYKDLLKKDLVATTSLPNGNKAIILGDDEYFIMGDNWGESKDCITQGPVKKSEIVGKVDFVIKMNENKFFAMLKQMIITTFKFN